jgi:GT2 family glycosyltransferase
MGVETDSRMHGRQQRSARRPVLIAVPFYKNEHLVPVVVGSLIACAADVAAIGGQIVFYNDSPDYAPLAATLSAVLPLTQKAGLICRIEVNPVNLGFVKTMNRAVGEAVDGRFDLLLLNSDTVVEPGALTEMVRVSRLDPMIAFVNPRTNNAELATLPLAHRLGGKVPTFAAYRSLATSLAALLPDYSYVPTTVGYCMLIMWDILAVFGGFDEMYGAGYYEEVDLVMRASRLGYRAVLANHAFVWHQGQQSFNTADRGTAYWGSINRTLFDRRYPEYDTFASSYFFSPEFVAEALVAALIPDVAGKLDLAFDFSTFAPMHNGTFQAGKQLLNAAATAWRDRFNIAVLCSPEVYEFWGYGETGACRCDPEGPEKFAVIFRVGQPYDWPTILRLAVKGAVLGLYMLDTISIDCPQLTSQRLFNLWQFALENADMVTALSRMTLGQLHRRFRIPERVVVSTVLLSQDVQDYRITGADTAAPGDGTLLVLGNHYKHKYLPPTANALADAFPDRAVIALGEEQPDAATVIDAFSPPRLSRAENLTGIAVGNLDEAELGGLYAQADAIVFPTHYEGFGIPVLNALAARRPVFVRPLPVFEELWRGQDMNPNIHFYETEADLVEQLRVIPAWREVARPPGNGADRMAREIRAGLEAALGRIDYRRIVERVRAVQFKG